MKKLIIWVLLIFSFTGNAFISNNPDRDRMDYWKVRPRPDKYHIADMKEIVLKNFLIKFYDNIDLKGKPKIIWDKSGVNLEGKLICGWRTIDDGRQILDPDCPKELPLGSAKTSITRPEGFMKKYTGKQDPFIRIDTLMELERYENFDPREYCGNVGVISFRDKEYYFNFKTLKEKGWRHGAGALMSQKPKVLKIIKSKSFSEFIEKGKKCVEEKDPICLESITNFHAKKRDNDLYPII